MLLMQHVLCYFQTYYVIFFSEIPRRCQKGTQETSCYYNDGAWCIPMLTLAVHILWCRTVSKHCGNRLHSAHFEFI